MKSKRKFNRSQFQIEQILNETHILEQKFKKRKVKYWKKKYKTFVKTKMDESAAKRGHEKQK